MTTPAEEAQAKAAQQRAAQLAVVKGELQTALTTLNKGVKVTAAKDKIVDDRLKEIYDEHAPVAVSQAQVKILLDKVVNNAMGDATKESKEIIAERKTLLEKTTPIADKVFSKKENLITQIDTLLTDVKEQVSGEFSRVKDAKKLGVLADLKSGIARTLNAEYKDDLVAGKTAEELKKEALKNVIQASLTTGTGDKLLKDVETTATTMAGQIFNADKDFRDEMLKFLDDEAKITGKHSAEYAKKIAEAKGDPEIVAAIEAQEQAKRDRIIASANDSIWPEMLRQQIGISNEEKMRYVKSVIADSIRGEGTLTATQQKDLDAVGSRLDAVVTFDAGTLNDEKTRAHHQFAIDAVKRSNGAPLLGGINIGTGTAVAGGLGAAAALAAPIGDFESLSGIAKKLLVAGAVTGIGVAYDQGAFDSLLKPSTPSGTKSTDTKTASNAK